jgi:hypothetical protein
MATFPSGERTSFAAPLSAAAAAEYENKTDPMMAPTLQHKLRILMIFLLD